jgi:hypothetical protein
MKVVNSGIISLKGPLARNKAIRNIRVGDMLYVKIIERTGIRAALLDIKGNKVHAEFRTDIPTGTNLVLLLEGKMDETLMFKLVSCSPEEASFNSLFDYSVFDEQNLSKTDMMAMHKILQKGISDIFSLSKIMLQVYSVHYKKKNAVMQRIFDKMSQCMSGTQQAVLFPLLFSINDPEEIALLYSIFLLFNPQKDKSREEGDFFPSGMTHALQDESIDEFLSLLHPDDMSEMLMILFNTQRNNVVWGNFTYAPDDAIRSIQYIRNNNAAVFSVIFSVVGSVDIVARKSDYCDITIYMDNVEALSLFDKNKDLLHEKIAHNIHQRVVLNILNRQTCLEKIIAINNSIKFNSALDVRV